MSGAVAVGAMIFAFVYWGFGFLRMGTTGFAAQANGSGDADEIRAVLGRALLVAARTGGGDPGAAMAGQAGGVRNPRSRWRRRDAGRHLFRCAHLGRPGDARQLCRARLALGHADAAHRARRAGRHQRHQHRARPVVRDRPRLGRRRSRRRDGDSAVRRCGAGAGADRAPARVARRRMAARAHPRSGGARPDDAGQPRHFYPYAGDDLRVVVFHRQGRHLGHHRARRQRDF